MEGVNLKKDLLFAVSLALAIHVCVALTRIPVAKPVFRMKTDQHKSLAISFVSTFTEAEKKIPAPPLIKKKKELTVKKERTKKKIIKKVAVRKENVPSKKNIETKVQEQSEAQQIIKTTVEPAHAPSFKNEPLQKEAAVLPAIPRYGENPPPVYPSIARRREYEGTVLLSVKILANGAVGDLSVKKSSGHSILDRAALKTVKKWKFQPASLLGIPFTMWVDVPVRFELKNND